MTEPPASKGGVVSARISGWLLYDEEWHGVVAPVEVTAAAEKDVDGRLVSLRDIRHTDGRPASLPGHSRFSFDMEGL